MLKLFVAISFLLLLACAGFSQDNGVKFQNLTVNDGLSQGNINAILSDSRGFLWFGTQDGLNRYDGYEFRVYKPIRGDKSSLQSNIIKTLYEDSYGLMWVGTAGGGLSCYDRSKDQFKTYLKEDPNPFSISSNHVYSIYEDSQKRLWVGTFGGGLNLFDRETGRFMTYRHKADDSTTISGNIVRAMIEADNGDLWLGVENGGLDRFNPENASVVEHYSHSEKNQNSLSNNAILSICQAADGKLWIGTWAGGINVFNTKTKRFKHYRYNFSDPHSLGSDENFSVFRDRKDRLWVSTRNGLDLYCPEFDGFKHYRHDPIDRFSLSHNHVISIFQDQNSLMWVGTEGGGINKFSFERKNFQYIDLIIEGEKQNYTNDVFSMYEDSNGAVWIGTKGGGLLEMDPQTKKLKRYVYNRRDPKSIGSNVVRAITQLPDGRLVVGTDGAGINIFDRNTEEFVKYIHDDSANSLSNNAVFDLFVDSDSLIWIGTYGGGLDCFNPKTGIFENYKIDTDNLSQNVALKLFEDKQKRLWVGSNGKGLLLFDRIKRKFVDYTEHFPQADILEKEVVFTIDGSKNGGIWVGTGGNSFFFVDIDKKYIHHFKDVNAHYADMVSGIIEDKKGNLWLSSNMGLFKYDVANNRYFHFTEVEGIQGVTFNQDATLKSRNGFFYMGGTNGINVFRPDSIYFDVNQPRVVITDFKIFNESVKVGKTSVLQKNISETDTIYLSYKDKIISFEFAGLHYFAPEHNKYRYKLEGFDNVWNNVSSDRRFATYTNLPGGKYRFRVKASNYDGIWNVEGTSVVLVVEPPFWKTMSFYLLMAGILLIIIYTVVKIRESQFHKLQSMLEEKVVERTDEIERQKQELMGYNTILNKQKEELRLKSESLASINQKLNEQTLGLQEKGEELEQANNELKKKNKFIIDSIDYAQKIQESILPSQKKLKKQFDDFFILYKPRDVVSGDFYWFAESDKDEWGKPRKKIIVACVDCTGHGVPGAFMSMIGNTLLNEIVLRQGIQDPKMILKMLNEEIISAFEKEDEQFSDDGMDISIATIDPEMQEMVVASAMQKVYVVSGGEVHVLEGDIFSIGEMFAAIRKPDFTNNHFSYDEGDALYMFSDGFQDQFGGEKNEKFREKRLRELIAEINHLPMAEQHRLLEAKFLEWKSGYNQIDDVLIMGMRLNGE